MIRRQFVQLLSALAVLSLATGALAQTRDTRGNAPVSPASTGTAAISGVVMSADSAPHPLRLANVVLIGATTGVLKVTSTDRDGRFSFTSLPADRYTVGASKLPYLGAVAGARRPARSGTPIVLTAGQRIGDVVIRLPLAAAISGVVTDELGQPTAGMVTVQQRRLQNGERVLVSIGNNATTDERGRYRIYGLPPGEYVLAAFRFATTSSSPRQLTDREIDDALRGNVPPAEPLPASVRYLPTYYPGTTRPAEASGIVLTVGDERTDVDVRLELVTTARVEGTVTTADGQLAVNASVTLATIAGSPVTSTFFNNVGQVGHFAFTNITPGLYTLTCNQGGPQGVLFGSMLIDVSGDQTGLQLILTSPTMLKGRIIFEGASPRPPLVGLLPTLKAMSKGAGSGSLTVATDATGAFSIQRLPPGTYIIGGPASFGANTNSMTWSLQSIVADGKDITDLPIDITPETAPKNIAITFADKWQGVSGKLLQVSGAPATDYTVIVFPADKAYWLTGSRRILTARPDNHGQFTLAGPGLISLPAGEYLLAVVTELDRDEQFDPALLASLVAGAMPLSIQPGETKIQDLVIR